MDVDGSLVHPPEVSEVRGKSESMPKKNMPKKMKIGVGMGWYGWCCCVVAETKEEDMW